MTPPARSTARRRLTAGGLLWLTLAVLALAAGDRTTTVVALVALVAVAAAAGLAAVADRTARKKAWRHIDVERQWYQEQRRRP